MSFKYYEPTEWDGAKAVQDMAADYSKAKMAEQELRQLRKVVWLLLKQIGEPVTIDKISLLQVPEDARILEMFEPSEGYDYVTLKAE